MLSEFSCFWKAMIYYWFKFKIILHNTIIKKKYNLKIAYQGAQHLSSLSCLKIKGTKDKHSS